MKSLSIPSLLIIGLIASTNAIECGVGWHPFSDEKCIKILDAFVPHDEAENLCKVEVGGSLDSILPPLLSIKSRDEQTYLTTFLFDESQIVDNIWLGATRGTDEFEFEWSDGSKFQFTHWREGHPTNHSENACVQITPAIQRQNERQEATQGHFGEDDGFWTDVSCLKKNLVVCQKLPTWSLLQLQNSFIELRRNPVPIGYIYVQLPNQPDADTAWPNLGWSDVSVEYEGLFFRTEGGEAAEFGTTQNDQTRRITDYEFTWKPVTDTFPGYIHIPETGWSEFALAGDTYTTGARFFEVMRMLVNDVEVRPRNTAVRIWKRIY